MTFSLTHADRCYHLSPLLKIGRECNYGSNLLYIDRHADAARPWETNVRKFESYSGNDSSFLDFLFDIQSYLLIDLSTDILLIFII